MTRSSSAVVASDSALGNVLRWLPRAAGIVRAMRPTWHLASPAQLDAAFLAEHRIRGLLWDVDGTLTAYHAAGLVPGAATLAPLLGAAEPRQAILSNAPEHRFEELGRLFPALPILKGYRRDGRVVLRRLEAGVTTMSDGTIWSGPSGLEPVRKPDPELLLAAVAALGLPADAVVMVGDQYFTDIAGATMAGVRSIKIPTQEPGSFPRGMRVGHMVEWLAYRLFHGRP